MSDPRIYVASLSDYNAGRLHGVWIDLEGKGAEEVHGEIAAMLAASKEPFAEEYAIHDHEGLGNIGEHESLETVVGIAERVAEHGAAFVAYMDHVGGYKYAAESFADAFRGEWDSEREYAEEFAHDCGPMMDVEGELAYYFNYAAYARDLFINDVFSEPIKGGAGVYVFIRHV